MAQYHFKSVWNFQSHPTPLWHALNNTTSWPEWWIGLQKVVEIKQADENGCGAMYYFVWGSPWLYTLKFNLTITQNIINQKIHGIADGDLQGTGTWLFESEGETTKITYLWNVRTTKKWMNVISPVLRPVFIANHTFIMYLGKKGLAKYLGIKSV